jgi:aryl-alcohol dehydrogenase-like predicted oxidoreductase
VTCSTVALVEQRVIGQWRVSVMGLGCMPASFPEHAADRQRGIAVIHRALDLGITLLDTANIYAPSWDAMGHNEAVVAEAMRSYSGPANLESVLIATKGGVTRNPGEVWGRDASREGLLAAAEASCRALGVEVMDLYQLHRPDPAISYAEQVRSLAAVRDAGLARMIGLSNASLPQLQIALEVVGGPADGGIVSVQNEFSPRFRGEEQVLPACTEQGIAFLPWSPLGGADQARTIGHRYRVFAEVGDEIGATAHEVALAWLADYSPSMIPIPGASRPETVDSIVRAADIRLTPGQMDRLSASIPEATSMYPEDLPAPRIR